MAKNPIFTGFLKDSSLHIPGNAGYIEQRTGVKWEEVRAELLKDPETAQAVKDLEPEYEIIQEIIEARIKQGLTQEDSSKCIDTVRNGHGVKVNHGNGN